MREQTPFDGHSEPIIDPQLAELLGVARQAPSVGPDSALLAEVEASLAKERSFGGWLRSRSTRLRWGLAVLGIIASAFLGGATLRPDLGVYPPLRLALELSIAVLAMLGGLFYFLRPLYRPRLPAALAVIAGTLLLVLGIAGAALPEAHTAHAASLAGQGPDFIKRAVGCLIFGTIIGLPAGFLIYSLGRGPGLGLIAGLVGGAAGLVGLHLHCPITSHLHLFAGHGPVPVMSALIAFGVTFGLRAIRAKRAARSS